MDIRGIAGDPSAKGKPQDDSYAPALLRQRVKPMSFPKNRNTQLVFLARRYIQNRNAMNTKRIARAKTIVEVLSPAEY